MEQDLRNGFADFLLELGYNFENVILTEDLLHSDDGLSVNDKDIAFVSVLQTLNVFLCDS